MSWRHVRLGRGGVKPSWEWKVTEGTPVILLEADSSGSRRYLGASSQGLSWAWWHQRSSCPSLPGLSQPLSSLLLPSSGVPGPPCSCRILWSRFSSENPQEAVHLSLPHSRPSLSRNTEPGARRAEPPRSRESHWERASLQGSTCPSWDTAGLGSSQ